MNDSEKLLKSSYEYIEALKEGNCVTSVSSLLDNAAYVYLSRAERLMLALRIIWSIFR